MATYWVPDLPDIESFAGRLWHSILIFANNPSFTWSSKHINMLGWVCSLVKSFLNTESAKIMKSDWGEWKRVSCHGNQNFYSGCVACRTISLPSFNGLCSKFSETGLFIIILDIFLGWVSNVTDPLICILYTLFKLKYLWNQCRYFETVCGVFNLS